MGNNHNINSKLGVLGGGQLGRMLIQSAIDLNLIVQNFVLHERNKDPPLLITWQNMLHI